MKKFVMLTVVALLVRPAYCAVTAHLSLDCREGAKIADTTHPLIYDASWYAGGVTSKITANGQEIVSGAAGACAWAPSSDGVCLLTLSVYNDSDEVVGTEQVFCLSREDLTELVIPEGTMEISDYAFAGGLFTSVTIPSSVTSIGERAFWGCNSLVTVHVAAGDAERVKEMIADSNSGVDVDSLIFFVDPLADGGPYKETVNGIEWTFTIVDGEAMIGPGSWNSAAISKETVGEIEIPSVLGGRPVTEIAEYAFSCCDELTSVTIPSSVKKIGASAFDECSRIASMTIHEGVTRIGSNAFGGCRSLKSITFPSTLEYLGDYVFGSWSPGCENMRVVYYCSLIPPACGENIYALCSQSLLSYIAWTPSTESWMGRAWQTWIPPPEGTGTGDVGEQSCVVVFDANGGSCSISSNQYVVGTELGELPAATREGYAFEGWFTEATGGERVTPATVVTEDVTLYAQWRAETIVVPVVDPPNGTVFRADDCLVTITTETDGAAIYYRVGAAPKASSKFLYSAPFTITDTSTIYTYAMKEGRSSATNVVTITKGEVLTFAEAASAEGITTFITDGDAEWIAEEDANAKVGNASVRSGEIDDDQISWFTAEVEGPGTLSFWWKASCEADELQEFDHLVFAVDDVVEGEVARLDGITTWEQITTTVSAGSHTLYWAYVKDESDFDGEDCGWVDGIVWTPSAAPVVGPTIEGDEGATVTGDAEMGFVVKPSEGKTAVEVTIPQGVDAAKVTVEVSPKVASVKPNGARVKVVNGNADITEFLNIPAADGNGVVDLMKAAVKEEVVKEAMDPAKGAKIVLDAANPSLTTPNTRKGLFYQLREGETLGGMKDGDSKVGDGQPWSPEITVKGGNSAFYSIGVGKGE